MSDIAVLGLGLMGSALAHSLQSAGHKITVWNRSPGKMDPFVAAGAFGAPSVKEAVESSPVTLVCVSSYAATTRFLGTQEVLPSLTNRTVVQLSTGTPKEALESEKWFNGHAAAYLDGAILTPPVDIKANKGDILIGGNKQAWESCEAVLRCLGGNLNYTGVNIRAPAILDLAWLCQRFGQYLGLFQGVLLCEAGNVGVDTFASIPTPDDRMRQVGNSIHENDFANPSVTVDVWRNVLRNIQDHAREAGVDTEVLAIAEEILQQGQSAGYSEEDVAGLVKVFRSGKLRRHRKT